MMTRARTGRARLNFAIFAVATVGAGWLGVAIDRAAGVDLANGVALSNSGGTGGQAVFIVLPALAAIGLYFLSRDNAGTLGFGLRFAHRASWFTAATFFYPAVTIATVTAGVAVGGVTFSVDPAPGKPAFLSAFALILGVQFVKNIIEEFIFRGYGTRTAMAVGLPGRAAPHLLVGTVWALWHLPLYLVWTSPSDLRLLTSLPWALFAPLLLVGIIATALVYGELRVRTGSIWPGVVLHSMCNAIATPLLVNGHLAFPGHTDAIFSPVPASILTTLIFGAAGLMLLSRGESPTTTQAGAEPVRAA